jgi:hypothetical protein
MPETSDPDSPRIRSELAAADAMLEQDWAAARDYLIGPRMEKVAAAFALLICLDGPEAPAYLRRQPDRILALVAELASLAAKRMGCEAAARMLDEGGDL